MIMEVSCMFAPDEDFFPLIPKSIRDLRCCINVARKFGYFLYLRIENGAAVKMFRLKFSSRQTW